MILTLWVEMTPELLNSLPLVVYSLIWIPIFIGFTVVEDNDLALRFGNEYLVYTKQVGLFWRKGIEADGCGDKMGPHGT